MRISFDLDDTLFINPDKTPAEPELKFPFSALYPDRLRAGTVSLMQYLHDHGIEVYIYTTSFRSERYIRNLFRHYHIQIDEIINGARHAREVQGQKTEPMPSKYPSHYRIDLHIDDDKSVSENGKYYGFPVYLIQEDDIHWTEKIIIQIQKRGNFHES
ncbi:MAG: HAD family hydrolase [Oscillospiraceae bacterium]|nr:HAD family hydrolase [Oscillospiraceae bacterium]